MNETVLKLIASIMTSQLTYGMQPKILKKFLSDTDRYVDFNSSTDDEIPRKGVFSQSDAK